ncbi:MAG: anti-sigma factor family protein [Sulfuriferula sp.]
MKANIQPVTLDDLMAYVDGQLDAQRSKQVEALVASDPQAAERVTGMRAQRQALRAHYDPVLTEPIPLRLLASRRHPNASSSRLAGIAASVLIGLALGSAGTWQYLSHTSGSAGNIALNASGMDLPRFVHQAAVAHIAFAPDVRRPVEIYSAQEQQLVTWLSKRLGRQLKVPDLASAGFSLVGGRLLPGEVNKPAAQFMYENPAGQRITLYLRNMAQPTPETAFRFAEEDGVATFYWVDLDWGYALSGNLPRATLLSVANSVYRQLGGY